MGKRKRYTNAEKLALARKASIPGCSIAFLAHAEGLPQSTVQGFLKNIKKVEENSTSENNLKAIHKDKIPMLKGQESLSLLSELDRQLRMHS